MLTKANKLHCLRDIIIVATVLSLCGCASLNPNTSVPKATEDAERVARINAESERATQEAAQRVHIEPNIELQRALRDGDMKAYNPSKSQPQ